MTSASKCIAITCALAALSISCGDRADRDESAESLRRLPDSLVGTWVRMYPSPAGKDTMVLNGDGSARGPGTAIGNRGPITRWQIGSEWGPTDLCIGELAFYCRKYRLRGDTLVFAGEQGAVLIRASALRNTAWHGDSIADNDRSRYGEVPALSKPGGVPNR